MAAEDEIRQALEQSYVALNRELGGRRACLMGNDCSMWWTPSSASSAASTSREVFCAVVATDDVAERVVVNRRSLPRRSPHRRTPPGTRKDTSPLGILLDLTNGL
jgi:hypothetical protein